MIIPSFRRRPEGQSQNQKAKAKIAKETFSLLSQQAQPRWLLLDLTF
jgi:hypothetical protein